MSSGNRVVYRLSLRENRRLNHAVRMTAVTQISHRGSEGRAYYDKKIAQGKTPKEALRAQRLGHRIPRCTGTRRTAPWSRTA